ncbi:hypothetical protein D9M72_348570 [compost metagenome]
MVREQPGRDRAAPGIGPYRTLRRDDLDAGHAPHRDDAEGVLHGVRRERDAVLVRDDAALQLPAVGGARAVAREPQVGLRVARLQAQAPVDVVLPLAAVPLGRDLVAHGIVDALVERGAGAHAVVVAVDVCLDRLRTQRNAHGDIGRMPVVEASEVAGAVFHVERHRGVLERLHPRARHALDVSPIEVCGLRIGQPETAPVRVGPAHGARVLALVALARPPGVEQVRVDRVREVAKALGLLRDAHRRRHGGRDRAAHRGIDLRAAHALARGVGHGLAKPRHRARHQHATHRPCRGLVARGRHGARRQVGGRVQRPGAGARRDPGLVLLCSIAVAIGPVAACSERVARRRAKGGGAQGGRWNGEWPAGAVGLDDRDFQVARAVEQRQARQRKRSGRDDRRVDERIVLAHLHAGLRVGDAFDHRAVVACIRAQGVLRDDLHAQDRIPREDRTGNVDLAALHRRAQARQRLLAIGIEVLHPLLAVLRRVALPASEDPVADVQAGFGAQRAEGAGATGMAAVHRQHVVVQKAGDAAAVEGVGPRAGPKCIGRHDEADLVLAGTQLDDRAWKPALEFTAGRCVLVFLRRVIRPAVHHEAGLVPQRLVEAQATVGIEGGWHQPAALVVDEQRHDARPRAKAGFVLEVLGQLRVDAALPEHVQVERGARLLLEDLFDDLGAVLAGQGKGRRRHQQHREHRRQTDRQAFDALSPHGRSHRQCAASVAS